MDAEQQGTQDRPDPVRGAADQRHGKRRDGVVQVERRSRIGKGQIHRVRRAGRAHQGAGDDAGRELELQRRHAGGFGGHFVVAQGAQAAPDPGALDEAGKRNGDHHHDGAIDEQHLDVAVERRHDRRPDHLHAGGTADELPVDDQGLDDDGDGNGGDGKEDAAHPEREEADQEAEQGADPRGGRICTTSGAPVALNRKTAV